MHKTRYFNTPNVYQVVPFLSKTVAFVVNVNVIDTVRLR